MSPYLVAVAVHNYEGQQAEPADPDQPGKRIDTVGDIFEQTGPNLGLGSC